MKYIKPVPVKKENIKVGQEYYTCSHTGVIKIVICRVFTDNAALVKIKSKKEHKPFIRSIDYIFDNPEMAKFASRSWESSERKRKK